MAIRPVLTMGNPKLLEVSETLEQNEFGMLDSLVEDMMDTMKSLDGAGLAAPQIGVMKRVVIFGFEDNPRYPHAESIPFTVLVNPIIEALDSKMDLAWEGCLSVPGMRGEVPRYTHVRYTGLDREGKLIERVAEGFHARVVQHECDHLDGILYPMRMTDMRKFGFESELRDLQGCPPAD